MTQNTKRKFRYLIALLILVGLASGFLYFLFSKSEPAEASWYDENWLYRQKTEITNSGSAQTDFQVLITLDTATLITASKMQSDCDDIRITDISGKLLSHWLESNTCNTSTSKIWAKVPSIPTTGATVYIYYGNPSAVSVSSPTNTFIREISGVQGAWNMDESSWTNDCSTNTALDSSGNANHAKSCPASTGPNTTSTAQFGRAGSFDGSNDYVDAGNGASLNSTDEITIEMWARIDQAGAGAGYMLLSKGYGSGTTGSYDIFNWDNKLYWEIGGTTWADTSISVTPYLNTWHHFSTTYSNGSAKIYVDGVLVKDASKTGSIRTSSYNLNIGRDSERNAFYFNGLIDNIRIYNKALSAAEISDIYGTGGDRQGYVTSNYPNKSLVRKYSANVSVGSPSSEERGPGPVAFWKFDEGYGQTANDTTLNNNDGTLGSTSGSDTNDPTWQTEDMCVSGKCLKFDGSDDYVNAGNGASLMSITNKATIEAWIKRPTFPIYNDPWRDYWTITYLNNNGCGLPDCADNLLELTFYKNTLYGRYSPSGGDDWSKFREVSSSNVPVNEWVHIALVLNVPSSSLTLYMNGISVSSASGLSGGLSLGTYPVHIGNFKLTDNTSFSGSIDDVRVYPYARTAAQIKADYASRGMAKGASAVIASGAKQSLSDGLVGYWKMDESSWTNDCSTSTVTDSSGAGNHAKSCPASTGPTNTTSTAKFARAGSFDGNDDYVDAGNAASLNITDAITISAWAKTSIVSDSSYDTIVSKFSASPYNGWFIRRGADENFLTFDLYNNGTTMAHIPGPVIVANEWRHYVGTFDGTTAKLYTNGVLSGTDTNASIGTATNNMVIGANYGGDPSWPEAWNGTIDEVRIYNRALSPKEVRDLYNWAPGPVAYWNMDEKTGQSANDSSGSGNTGTLGASSGVDSSDPTWVSAKIGAGLQFDGVNDYVDAGDIDALDGISAFTICSWSKRAATNEPILIGKDLDSNNRITLERWTNGNTYVSLSNGSNAYASFAEASTNWDYICMVFDGSKSGNAERMKVYFNGVAQSLSFVGTFPATTPSTAVSFRIGRTASSGPPFYSNGSIDDVRIYNYARTQKQIVEDMLARQSLSGGGNADCDNTVLCTKFDEGYGGTAQDSSPQNNDGTLYPGSGGTNTTTAQMWSNSAKFGKAMEFDGTDDYVGGNSVTLATNAVTMETWVNITGVGSGGNTVRPILDLGGSWGGKTKVYLGWGQATNQIVFTLYNGTTGADLYSNDSVSWNTWNHIVATWNGTTKKIFINGKEQTTTQTLSGTINAYFNYIGRENVNYFSGLIDEVKIYNYALTEDEIKLEYNRGAATMLGAVSTDSSSNPSYSSDRSYCIPGDTSTCNPPVAEWTFNEKTGQSANDTSGNGNTGTLGSSSGSDSSDPQWVSAKIGAGLQFDGSDDYVNAGSGASLNITDAITIEAWVKANVLPSTDIAGLVFKMETGAGNVREGYSFFIETSKKVSLYVGINNFYDGVTGNTVLTTGRWYHLVGVHDGSKLYMYVNGISDVIPPSATQVPWNAADHTAVIGRSWDYNPQAFNGLIDDVRIYNYARTPAQIAWDYNRGKPVAHWKFDECQGATAYDASGNANHGTTTIGASGTQDGIGTCTDGDTTNARYNGRNGKYNSALNFDGTDDYVNTGDPVSLDITSAITLEAWVYKNSDVNWQRILQKTASVDYALLFDNTGKVYTQMNIGGTTETVYSDSSLDIQRWYHVVAKYDGSKVYLYINGIKQSYENLASGTITTSSGNLNIGRDPFPAGYFNGLIDEVKIYNYALTPLQIKTEYNEGSAIRFGPSTGAP